MISLTSKTTIESKTTPGVKFTVRTLNRVQRAKRDLAIMATRQRISAILAEYKALDNAPDDQRSDDDRRRMMDLDKEYMSLQDTVITPFILRAGLLSVVGIALDGIPVTTESLIEFSLGANIDGLIDEIRVACDGAAGLSATEIKNSLSDSTSTAPAAIDQIASDVTCADV